MVQKTNKNFESKVADPTKLLLYIKRLYSTIANKILLPTARIDIYEQDFEKYLNHLPDLGYAFESSCTENEVLDQEKENLKSRCVSFLIALAKELKNRLPDNIKILERINAFSVNECLKANKLSITDVALYYKIDAITIALIELEWENIHHVRWKETQDTKKFWIEVINYRDASGQNPFKNLTDLAFKLLCLPHSNADVKRVFSQMNLIKTKLRNKIKLPLLNNILYIRFGLKRLDTCCNNYTLPENILKSIGNVKMYEKSEPESDAHETEVEDISQLLLQ